MKGDDHFLRQLCSRNNLTCVLKLHYVQVQLQLHKNTIVFSIGECCGYYAISLWYQMGSLIKHFDSI